MAGVSVATLSGTKVKHGETNQKMFVARCEHVNMKGSIFVESSIIYSCSPCSIAAPTNVTQHHHLDCEWLWAFRNGVERQEHDQAIMPSKHRALAFLNKSRILSWCLSRVGNMSTRWLYSWHVHATNFPISILYFRLFPTTTCTRV